MNRCLDHAADCSSATPRTVGEVGWASFKNGVLLRLAATNFDVLITADQNIEFQQNLEMLPLAVRVLVADSNRLESLEPLVPKILDALDVLKPKKLIRVGA